MKKNHDHFLCCHSGGIFWALLILALGLWFLAKDLGFISLNVSMWPVILIIIGLWMLLKRNRC